MLVKSQLWIGMVFMGLLSRLVFMYLFHSLLLNISYEQIILSRKLKNVPQGKVKEECAVICKLIATNDQVNVMHLVISKKSL